MTYKKFLAGFAVGDAVGVPVEFKSRDYLRRSPVRDMIGFGTFKKPAGTWSDDTTMTIATMESIARLKTIDYNDIMNNFAKWYKEGAFTIDGLFDIGNTTRRAVFDFMQGVPALQCGGDDIHSNGNGSLMRILPVAFYLHSKFGNNFTDEAMEIIHNVSSLTHAHDISKMCCGFYCLIAAELITGKSKEIAVADGLSKGAKFYRKSPQLAEILDDIFNRLFDENFAKLPEDVIGSSGYVLDSLEASIWCLLNTSEYKSLILKAVNLGADTDTTGAIAAGLGSLVYNVKDLPTEWINKLRKIEYLESIETSFLESLE